MIFNSEQEEFWAGEFGTQYTNRNTKESLLTSNIDLFSKIIPRMQEVNSVIEYGANIGLNLKAIKTLYPSLELAAVEINTSAVMELKKNEWLAVHHDTLVNFKPTKKYDFAFVKGVLIHINPSDLDKIYDLLYYFSNKYIMVAEYYNPTPVSIDYRCYKNKLFKRDFAGDLLDKFSDLRLVDYGFCYHRDPHFPQDDITWFLLHKT